MLLGAAVGQRTGRHVRLARARLPQGAVLPRGIDHVPHAGGRRGAPARGLARHRARDGARGDGRAGRLLLRGGVARMTSLAFHVDQLFFPSPGGIGTYARRLVPALAKQDPSLDIKLFHARFEGVAPERWTREFWVEELPRG